MSSSGGSIPPWHCLTAADPTRPLSAQNINMSALPPHRAALTALPANSATPQQSGFSNAPTPGGSRTRWATIPVGQSQQRIAPPPLFIRGIDTQPYNPIRTATSSQVALTRTPPAWDREGGFSSYRENYCESCERGFKTKDLLELHEAEDHVLCDFVTCSWNGPPHALLAHRLTHLRDEKGEAVTVSQTETELWLAARRRYRGIAAAKTAEEAAMYEAQPVKLSILEKTLRSRNHPMERSNTLIASSALLPNLARYVQLYESRRKDLMRPAMMYKAGMKVPFSATFPICQPLLYNKPCPCPEKCKRSHDVRAYRRWEMQKNKSGARVRNLISSQQSLMYVLLADEIMDFENILVLACKAIYDRNFFRR